jgi:hypothetical protein
MTDTTSSQEYIRTIENLSRTAFNERSQYETLWKKIATYCNLNKEFQQERKNFKKQDIEINNSKATIALNQSSDSMLGILIGDGHFFKLKLKDSVKDILEESNIQYSLVEISEQVEYINSILREQLFNNDSNFIKSLHMAIKEYFAYGNTGIGVFKNPKQEAGITDTMLTFINYSVNNTAFMDGQDGIIDTIFMKYQWDSRKIVKTFCTDENGIISPEKLSQIPERIQTAYESNNNSLETFPIDYVLMPNPDYRKDISDGIYSARYIGQYIDFADQNILQTNYYKKMPVKIIRDGVTPNEIYGIGMAGNIIADIELSNKISGDVIEQIENTVKPYLAAYENIINDKIIELDRNKPILLNSVTQNPNPSQPFMPIISNGDISSVVQILLPEINSNISSGLKADVFLDFNSNANMTATESMQRYNIRNKVLFANALDFQNLLNHIIYQSYFILSENGAFIKKSEVIDFLNQNNPNWFDIEYTSELAQISRSTEIQSITQFINSVTMLRNIYEDALTRVDMAKVEDKLDKLFNNTTFLIDESEFQKIKEQQAQVQQQQMQLANTKAEAEINNINAGALKQQKEANMTAF